LAAADETNLSTPQSAAQTHARLSGADGEPRRAQRAQTPSRQRPQAACDSDTSETTRLSREETVLPRLTFATSDRLHRRTEFLYVQREGLRAQTDHFVVYAARFPNDNSVRLGTAISRRLGCAVVRNRLRRRIRECFRLGLRLRLPAGTGVVVIGRTGAGALVMGSVTRELVTAMTNLRPRLSKGHE
jgi:ribonuclease P protein component